MKNVGFIGLGRMGRPMARAILAGEYYRLIVHDICAEAQANITKHGAIAASSPAEVAMFASIIFVCVRSDDDVRDVLFGENGIVQTASTGAVVIIHSTISIATLLEVAGQCTEYGVKVVDVAVTGGVRGAESSSLCYMFGGDTDSFNICTPILELSSNRIIYAGDLGSGMIVKICNNMITWSSFVAIHESLKIAEAAGFGLKELQEVSKSNGVLTRQMVDFIRDRDVARDGEKDCQPSTQPVMCSLAELGEKDLDAALDLAEELGQILPGCISNRALIRKVLLDAY